MISIIIPTLNEEVFIGPLIEYLYTNASTVIEIIIVDGNSNDNTAKIVGTFSNVRFYQHNYSHRAKQMNYGALNASYDILYFVHADCIPPKSFTNDIIQAISTGKQFGFFRQKFISNNILLKINSFFTRYPKIYFRGGDQSMFASKTLFNSLKGFNENYVVMEEYDFINRAKTISPICVIPQYTLVSVRKYQKNNYFKVQWANFIAMRMFLKGCDSVLIKNKYETLIRY